MTVTSTGARVVFKINNTPVMFANAVSYDVDHNLEGLFQLDSLVPAEYYETHVTVKFTCNMFRVVTKSATSQGIMPSISNILIRPELSCSLLDKVTMLPIFNISRVKCGSEHFEISAREIGSSSLSFVGISMTSDNK